MRNIMLVTSALALVATPTLASAAPVATSLSVAKSVRQAAPSARKSKLAGSGLIIVALAAVAVGGGLYLAIDGDSDSDSN